jgi:uncharacterized membrane protein
VPVIKLQFLTELGQALDRLPIEERADILRDYEEYFAAGGENGKSEAEIVAALGSPKLIARELQADYHVRVAEQHGSLRNVWNMLRSAMVLSFLNVILVLPAFVLGLVLLFTGWVVCVSMISTPLIWLANDSVAAPMNYDTFVLYVTLALAGLGLLLTIPFWALSLWFSRGFVDYVKYTLAKWKRGVNHEEVE